MNILSIFYSVMEFLSEFELAIAEATGRNPDHIRQLKSDWRHWQGERMKHEALTGEVK